MIHQLKCESKFFQDIVAGVKTYEVRLNDRNYAVGDYLALNEIDYSLDREETYMYTYTGNSALYKVVYVLNDETFCKDGYVIMSIRPCMISISGAGKVAQILTNFV